jgi:glutamyl-tRNA synthetase
LQSLGQVDWTRDNIAAAMKATLAEFGLKMPKLAMPVRLLVFGSGQTPSVDAMLAAMPAAVVLNRLEQGSGGA